MKIQKIKHQLFLDEQWPAVVTDNNELHIMITPGMYVDEATFNDNFKDNCSPDMLKTVLEYYKHDWSTDDRVWDLSVFPLVDANTLFKRDPSKLYVYIVLWWFYEGDSNLVDSYFGVYFEEEKAYKAITTNQGYMDEKIFGVNDELPEERHQGNYGDAGFYQIKLQIVE